MSKKAEGVISGGFQPMSLDAKARIKSQTLLLEYQDLQRETYGVRMKMDSAQQKRRELQAEVRFLRKRHRYLLKIKSMESPTEQQSNIKDQNKLTTKDRKLQKREASRFKLPPLPEKPRREKDVNYRKRVSRDTDAAFCDVIHFKDAENFTVDTTPTLDLNLDNGGVVSKEDVFPIRIPTFDLNEVSMEEEEVQVNEEQGKPEEPKRNMIRAGGGYDEQANEMKISSVCRNNSGEGGGGGTSRIGKRKISWQDPVALRV